jgi:hypothetical protein
MIRTYFQMLLEEAEASQTLPRDARMGETAGKMKQFASWFTHGVAGGAKLRAGIYQARTGADVLAQVDAFFASQSATDALVQEVEDQPGMPEAAMVCD